MLSQSSSFQVQDALNEKLPQLEAEAEEVRQQHTGGDNVRGGGGGGGR